jgi:hypothetical protein
MRVMKVPRGERTVPKWCYEEPFTEPQISSPSAVMESTQGGLGGTGGSRYVTTDQTVADTTARTQIITTITQRFTRGA